MNNKSRVSVFQVVLFSVIASLTLIIFFTISFYIEEFILSLLYKLGFMRTIFGWGLLGTIIEFGIVISLFGSLGNASSQLVLFLVPLVHKEKDLQAAKVLIGAFALTLIYFTAETILLFIGGSSIPICQIVSAGICIWYLIISKSMHTSVMEEI